MLSSNLFSHTHWSWYIDCKYNAYFLLSYLLLIKNLCSSLNNVVDLIWFRDFLGLNLNEVWGVAELAIPNLLWLAIIRFLIFILAVHVKSCLATFTEYWITCSQFWALLQHRHVYWEDISINFLSKLLTLLSINLLSLRWSSHHHWLELVRLIW